MKVTFRVDDISLYMDWEKFNYLIDIFNKYNIKPLLGVIPDNQDIELKKYPYNPIGWDELFKLKNHGYVISQHGYRHVYTTNNSGILGLNNYSEFAGKDYVVQYNMILEGKKILEQKGLASDIFMAPAHSFDKNTLIALKELRFKYVTDGYSVFPYKFMGLKLIPCQSSKPVKGLFGINTVCLHPNEMKVTDINNLSEWIERYRNKVCDYNYALNYPSFGMLSKLVESLVLKLRKHKRLINSIKVNNRIT